MSLASIAAQVHADARRGGVDLVDMRAEAHLEPTFVGAIDLETPLDGTARASVERFEDEPVIARAVPKPVTASEICYFLDGAQRTLGAFLIDTIPVIACIGGAAVLERGRDGYSRVMPGMFAFKHHWLVPMRTGNPNVDRFIALLQGRDQSVVDPLRGLVDDSPTYHAACDDYATIQARAYRCGTELRQELEDELLEKWNAETSDDAGWIVVDGTLRIEYRRAIGLVKSFTRQHLGGNEAATMFRLAPRQRTSAFCVQDKWREGKRTCWYQRFWDASGRDPRHALVRIETGSHVNATEEIDLIAGWLLAERLPRATADQRWATLLYPVHFLENILKRKIESETRGWPAPR